MLRLGSCDVLLLFSGIILAVIKPVTTDTILEIHLVNFTNFDRELANGRYCGNGPKPSLCHTVIQVCAYEKPRFGSVASSCSLGFRRTSVLGDNVLKFDGWQMGGVNNPLVLTSHKPAQRFGVNISVYDESRSRELNLINTYIAEPEITPKGDYDTARFNTFSARGIFPHSSAILGYQIRIYCAENYYGIDCSRHCSIQSSEFNRFFCNDRGDKTCHPWFIGQSCNIPSPCRSAPCKNGATCTAHDFQRYTCSCIKGYTGFNCEKGIDECSLIPMPCYNGATCVDKIGYYECKCQYGYTGKRCEQAIDACASSPCRNGGTCNNLPEAKHACFCPPGYTGTSCEWEVDVCASTPCLNGATCLVDRGLPRVSYICHCLPGFFGANCGKEVCRKGCLNGGTCVSIGIGYACRCPPGYRGDRCQSTVGACDSSPCDNGGLCVQAFRGMYSCRCRLGFSGPRCRQIDSACASVQCRNGGRCRNTASGGFVCICPRGLTGRYCEQGIKTCASGPCQNGGRCEMMNGNTAFRCVCSNGFVGKYCEGGNPRCSSLPCLHGGTCLSSSTGYSCRCLSKYYGTRCENERNPDPFTVHCPQPSGLFPDQTDCTKFYHCSWGTAFRKQCPGELHFSPTLLVCDWPQNAGCAASR